MRVSNKEEEHAERTQMIHDWFFSLLPALIIIVIAIIVILVGNIMNSGWSSEVKTAQAEVNELSIENVRNIARVQLLEDEQKNAVGAADISRQNIDDAIMENLIDECLVFDTYSAIEPKRTTFIEMTASGEDDKILDTVYLSGLSESTENVATCIQTVDSFNSCLYSVENTTYKYEAIVTGTRNVSGMVKNGLEYVENENFTWLLSYAVTEDGDIYDITGVKIVQS